jgi:NAD(P)-dependent dehydrogenase (short-subunit alcohol dehydrogenase family)
MVALAPLGPSSFDLSGQVAVVTGGSGALGRAVASGLAGAGARVAVVARHAGPVQELAAQLTAQVGGLPAAGTKEPAALGLVADVVDQGQLEAVRQEVMDRWGRVDIVVNAAGGNQAGATVPAGGTFFDLDPQAFRAVVDLNLVGTFLAVQVFAAAMVSTGTGSIVNVSSAAASWPLSRVAGYGSAKAGVENLTRWLAEHIARQVSPGIRVNAVAPGFFVGDQNRALLTNPDGSLTDRGQAVVTRTPMGRLGQPLDLVGPVLWLASGASSFVTGAVIPVDGGFLAGAGI